MGVPGLWDILRPAGQLRSLTHISVTDGFEANPDGKRGFRVGIDASIWFYHATYGREGENPELRTLFFRCTRLMSMPFLPLFVFDGPKRPDVKRGKRISGKNHWMVQGMQEIITAFGFEWRMAPGEAEAELAYLNRIGVIDAVLSDDVDTFLFGAKTVIRNPSATLSGNRAHAQKSAGGKDGNHAMVYRSSDILNHEDVQLTQGGLILIGILRGGDYCQSGLDGCGIALAHGLAKCGFGDELLKAARTKTCEELEEFLDGWREDIRAELRTNARGHLPRKSPKLAKSIPDDFPNVDVVLAYTTPVTSEAKGPGHKNTMVDWDKEPDLGKIAALCEMYFEWGIREIIIKRFRTVLWPSAVLRILRRAAILKDRKRALLDSQSGGSAPATPRKNGRERRAPPGTPSSMIAKHFSTMRLDSPHGCRAATLDEEDEDEDEEPLIVKIHSSRRHASTDNVLEYRLEVAPAQLVRLCEAGLKGLRTALPPDLSDDEDEQGADDDDDEEGAGKKGKKKAKAKTAPPPPDSHCRIWLPACMVQIVEPELVDEFEGVQRMKAEKKAAKGAGKKGAATSKAAVIAAAGATKGKKAAAAAALEDEESSSSSGSSHAGSSRQPEKAKAAPVAKKASQPSSKASQDKIAGKAGALKTVDVFFKAAKKPAAGVSDKSSRSTTSAASRVADLFKDIPPAPPSRPTTLTLSDTSDDDEVPRPPHLSHASPKPNATSLTKATSPPRGSSRLLGLLESNSSAAAAGPSKPAAPTAASTSTRALRPFPMEFDSPKFDDRSSQPSPTDEDLFSGWRSSCGGTSESSARTRPRPTVSSYSDSRPSASGSDSGLQKSPRRSEKHSSPRSKPPKAMQKQKDVVLLRREEEEESDSSDDVFAVGERAPSPSPLKGRLPTSLGGGVSAARCEEEGEESDAPPVRRPVLPMRRHPKPLKSPRKLAPLPADLTIISISSDSEDDAPPPPPPPRKVAPLLQARAKLKATDLAASSIGGASGTSSAATSTSLSARGTRIPQRRNYDPADIIDLT